METCDVLIVGGGPAGSSCARRLVDAGVDVLLVDSARFPRDKVCAGWITPAVVRALNLDIESYGLSRTIQPFTGFRTGALDGRLRLTDFGTAISYGIRRCEFDAYRLDRSGVRRLEDQRIRSIRRDAVGWLVNGSIRARMLVGAAGHFCPVARELNRGVPESVAITAQEIEFSLDDARRDSCPVDGRWPELFFWPDLAGYGWCVRKGAFMNVGAGRLAPAPLPRAMQEFTALLEGRRGVWFDTLPKWKGHAYLLNRSSRRRVLDDGVLLAGDAAGLALAPSGEGILTAVESGLLAAQTILEARPDYSAGRLAPYETRVRRRFGLRPGDAAEPRVLPEWIAATLSRALLGVPWLTRRVLLEAGFLHSRRPDMASA